MKIKITILIAIFCIYTSTFASNDTIINDTRNIVDVNDTLFSFFKQNVYDNPFLLVNMNSRTVTKINAEMAINNGDFYSPFGYTNGVGADVNVTSLLKVKKWHLYGMFKYNNHYFDKSHIALSAPIGYGYSPIFMLQHKTAEWNIQNYIFETIVARKISRKIDLGLRLNYYGKAYYRKRDLRNEQLSLQIKPGVGIGYKIFPNTTLGIHIDYEWYKTSPKLSNMFQNAINEDVNKPFMNVGFGTIISNPGFNFDVINSNPTFMFLAKREQKDGFAMLRLYFSNRTEYWNNLNIRNIELIKNQYKYKNQQLKIDFIHHKSSLIYNQTQRASIVYQHGRSFYRDNEQPNFLNVYFDNLVTGELHFQRTMFRRFIRKIEFSMPLSYLQQRDKNYASELNFARIEPNATLQLNHSFDKLKKYLQMQIGVGFNACVFKKNILGAISGSKYEKIVGSAYYDFATQNFLKTDAKLCYYTSYNRQSLEFYISANYLKAIGADSNYSLLYNNTQHLILKIGANILF